MENKIKFIPLSLFVLYITKMMILGNASPVDAAIILICGACSAYYEYKTEAKRLLALENAYKQQLEVNKQLEKNIENLKTHVSGLKIGQTMRPTAGPR